MRAWIGARNKSPVCLANIRPILFLSPLGASSALHLDPIMSGRDEHMFQKLLMAEIEEYLECSPSRSKIRMIWQQKLCSDNHIRDSRRLLIDSWMWCLADLLYLAMGYSNLASAVGQFFWRARMHRAKGFIRPNAASRGQQNIVSTWSPMCCKYEGTLTAHCSIGH